MEDIENFLYFPCI